MKEWESTGSEVPSLNGWSEVLAEVQARIARRFARAEVRERVGRYLVGLIDRVERKNGWQLAEALGEQGPQGVQRLLNAAVWDAEGVRDDSLVCLSWMPSVMKRVGYSSWMRPGS